MSDTPRTDAKEKSTMTPNFSTAEAETIAWEWARELEFDNEQLTAERDALREDKARLLGWRENDWPEGFCRRTAEALCEHVKGEER